MRITLPFLALALMLSLSSLALAAERSVRLKVDGMTCASCVYQVDWTLSSVDGVRATEVLGHLGMADVVFEDSETGVEQLVEALAEVGYRSEPAGPARLVSAQ